MVCLLDLESIPVGDHIYLYFRKVLLDHVYPPVPGHSSERWKKIDRIEFFFFFLLFPIYFLQTANIIVYSELLSVLDGKKHDQRTPWEIVYDPTSWQFKSNL